MQYTLANLDNLPRLAVAVAPTRPQAEPLTIERCREVVAASQVRARGWYFPHIEQRTLVAGPQKQYLSNETEVRGFVDHLEKWRMHRGGQFLFRMMLWEVPNDALQEEMRERIRWALRDEELSNIRGFVSFLMLIYSISEAYTFASRLVESVPYESSPEVVVRLRGVRDWSLGSSQFGVDLDSAYVARNDTLEESATIPIDNLVAEPLVHAVGAIQGIFAQFGWLDAAPGMIQGWQREIFK